MCLCACLSVCMCVWVCVCFYVLCLCLSVCMCVWVCVLVCVAVFLCIYWWWLLLVLPCLAHTQVNTTGCPHFQSNFVQIYWIFTGRTGKNIRQFHEDVFKISGVFLINKGITLNYYKIRMRKIPQKEKKSWPACWYIKW